MATATTTTALPRLSPDEADAWFGVLNAQAALVRGVDAELLAAHRLSCSSHEILYRLAHSEEGHLSIGELGAAVVISPSRVSRVVDGMGMPSQLSAAARAMRDRAVSASVSGSTQTNSSPPTRITRSYGRMLLNRRSTTRLRARSPAA